ncbi:MAG: error-prone DNA polymerase [Pseudonocardia sp.]|nr:error-prone DNA polymerase [Pseudonocardia sp.]
MGWSDGPESWRDFERQLSWGAARPAPPAGTAAAQVRSAPTLVRAASTVPWAELHVHTAFSFLDGADSPAVLVGEAARLGVEVLAVTDHDGMYGAVELAEAARPAGLGTVFGAELSLGLDKPQGGRPDPGGQHLLVLARSAEGYRRLCRVITAAQMRGERGRPVYDWAEIVDNAGGRDAGHWAILTGCRKGTVPAAVAARDTRRADWELRRLVSVFGRASVFVELVDQDQPLDDPRNDALADLAGKVGVGVVASNQVHYAGPRRARVWQVLSAARARRSLDEMVGWMPAASTRHLRSGDEMARRFARFPGVVEATMRLGRECVFDFQAVRPELPPRKVGEGHTDASWLRKLTMEGAAVRYGPRGPATEAAYRQLEHELGVIAQLGFPGYFLIVHEIVDYARQNNVLCQGRGSAANSAVCYALGITAVDPVKHGLLFERFLSVARDGPPDIDIDIENARREQVLQHIYDTYGRDRAAMVCNVNTYRQKMAIRDVARALGYSTGQADTWSRRVAHLPHPSDHHGDPPPDSGQPDGPAVAQGEAAGEEGKDPDAPPELVAELVDELQHLPRHLSIHSGGVVLCDRPIGEVCPTEWAAMPDRSILQWDKESCAVAGLVKIDCLGLGMLAALHDAFDLIEAHHGRRYELHTVPDGDEAVYDMICDADTVGVFQIESRAQMATLPRLRPRTFYDLVVEVALIRPGPIQGGSVHPYLRRRHGREDVTYPHPLLKPALERTLGVPLFQEQMMQIAIDCAGFTPAEADRLRQAMGSKRAPEKVEALRDRLMTGMAARDISPGVAEDIYTKLLGFSSYGFPESHAFSFAYIVYASCFLKRYYPAAFTTALLRNQPMGFYPPRTLLADARRHGVTVRPVDVQCSDVEATLEDRCPVPDGLAHAPVESQPAIRLGLGTVRYLGAEHAARIAAGRPYRSMEDLARRTGTPTRALEALATADAFASFGLSRRAAVWAAGGLAGVGPGQLDGTTPGLVAPELPAMTPVEETFADLWAIGVTGTHPVAHLRHDLDLMGVTPAERLRQQRGGRVIVAGVVTHRQRPPTAGGVVFLNLEDETGMVNVILPPEVWRAVRTKVLDSGAFLIHGRLERADGAVNVIAERLAPFRLGGSVRSRDFR